MNRDIPGSVAPSIRSPQIPVGKLKVKNAHVMRTQQRELMMEPIDIKNLSHVVEYALERSLGLTKKREKISRDLEKVRMRKAQNELLQNQMDEQKALWKRLTQTESKTPHKQGAMVSLEPSLDESALQALPQEGLSIDKTEGGEEAAEPRSSSQIHKMMMTKFAYRCGISEIDGNALLRQYIEKELNKKK